MHNPTGTGASAPELVTRLLLVAAATICALLLAASPAAAGGGISAEGKSSGEPKQGGPVQQSGPVKKAKLLSNGKAIAPTGAPRRVKRAIAAANRIRRTKYVWGGGHADFEASGYDCSGAVSYMLHGARMLKSPMASGGLAGWGREGRGRWISVYANGGHVYAVIAGLRWDTSGGAGPRWHADKRSSRGFQTRHFKGY